MTPRLSSKRTTSKLLTYVGAVTPSAGRSDHRRDESGRLGKSTGSTVPHRLAHRQQLGRDRLQAVMAKPRSQIAVHLEFEVVADQPWSSDSRKVWSVWSGQRRPIAELHRLLRWFVGEVGASGHPGHAGSKPSIDGCHLSCRPDHRTVRTSSRTRCSGPAPSTPAATPPK